MAASFRSVRSLSVYPNPAPGGLMAILRAYFDDSKDDNILTIAGYLSNYESWERFDPAWKAVLDEFEVPYLHMKEFWDTDGLYKHIKADPEREASFFTALVKVIQDHVRSCVETTVLLDDLKRFNRKHRRNLSAHGLAIYGCLMRLQHQFTTQPIEVTFDKFERALSLIQMGIDYAESDELEPLNQKLVLATRVGEDESWRTILPLQAADLVAWEMRKFCSDPLPWISKLHFDDIPQGKGLRSFNEWSAQFAAEQGRPPRDRKSFKALRVGRARPEGFLFNYAALELLNERHPHGWRLTKARRLAVFSAEPGRPS